MQELAAPSLPEDITSAFDTAYNNIAAFHRAQAMEEAEVVTMPGVRCKRVTRPIGVCGGGGRGEGGGGRSGGGEVLGV